MEVQLEADSRQTNAINRAPIETDLNTIAPQTIVIEAGRLEERYWRDLWLYRELIYFLSLRDILVRYKQTAIGVAWTIVRPLLTMLALTWIFSRGAHLKTGDPSIPYALWVFVATLPWQFFADGLTASSNSLIANTSMITKIYFPRVILPVSRVFVSFIDFSITALVLGIMIVFYHFSRYHFTPNWRTIFIPFFLLMAFASVVGVGLWFASLNVKYRDFTYIVPFIVTFGLYVSPVGISSANVTGNNPTLRSIYSLNPMVGVIDGFRWCIFGDGAPLFLPGLFVSMSVVLLLLLGGAYYFRKVERSFADII
jgi:lipopolysaccharide transport system permease protein